MITKTAQATLQLEDPVINRPDVIIRSCYYQDCCDCICYVIDLKNIGDASAEIELTNYTDKCLRPCDDEFIRLTIPAGEEASICFSYCDCHCHRYQRVMQYAKAVVNNGYQVVESNQNWVII